MTAPVKLLLIFINETDRWGDMPLDLALVQRLMKLNIAGATSHTGRLGFGRHLRLHHKGLFGVSDDRPVTIAAADDEGKIRSALPEVRRMVNEGLILLLDAEVVGDI